MSEGQSLVTAPAAAAPARRRVAPRSAETSDVARPRGVYAAALLAGAGAALAVVLGLSSAEPRAPGPLARPHREAALQCSACHDEAPLPGASMEAASTTRCVGCHGPHPSTRAAHRKLAERGELRCTGCHRIHRDDGGVAFTQAGAIRFGPGRDDPVVLDDPTLPRAGVVPIVPAGACAACHDPARERDPIARCLVDGHDALGAARPTVCLDEHRALVGAELARTSSVRERLALWEAARAAVVARPTVDAPAPATGGRGWALALGLGAAAFAWPLVRLARRPRRRAAAARVAVEPAAVRRLPQVNTATCIGCNACVDACPYDVLEMRNYVAVVVRPHECCGLTLCEQRCPNGSVVVTDGEAIEDRPRVDADLQSLDVPGVYVAGDLTGLPLIRNAMGQGARAIEAIARSLQREPSPAVAPAGALDLVIVGTGPAGLSAALRAKAAGLRYLALEQGSVAHSIRSFPRGKLVLDQPLADDERDGALWLRECGKEELLAQWLKTVRMEQLAIAEQHRVLGVSGGDDGWLHVRALAPAGEIDLPARRVLVAVGRRGTPRKLALAIPAELENRVHYSLLDAQSFAGQRVVVIGLGDVAMEATIALVRQRGTEVTVSYRGEGFRRGKARNVAELQRLVGGGRVRVVWSSELGDIAPGRLGLTGPAGRVEVAWDALFVLVGAIPPWSFLEACGVRRTANSTTAHVTQIASTSLRSPRPPVRQDGSPP